MVIDTHAPAAYAPCVKPATINLQTDAAAELLAVTATGSSGGPGVWRLEAVVTNQAVPAGVQLPAKSAAHEAGAATDQATDTVHVSVHPVDMVVE